MWQPMSLNNIQTVVTNTQTMWGSAVKIKQMKIHVGKLISNQIKSFYIPNAGMPPGWIVHLHLPRKAFIHYETGKKTKFSEGNKTKSLCFQKWWNSWNRRCYVRWSLEFAKNPHSVVPHKSSSAKIYSLHWLWNPPERSTSTSATSTRPNSQECLPPSLSLSLSGNDSSGKVQIQIECKYSIRRGFSPLAHRLFLNSGLE